MQKINEIPRFRAIERTVENTFHFKASRVAEQLWNIIVKYLY